MTHREFEGWAEFGRRLKAATEAGSPDWARLPYHRRVMRAEGGKLYFTGIPCKRGHVTLRNKQGYCTQCYLIHLAERRRAV